MHRGGCDRNHHNGENPGGGGYPASVRRRSTRFRDLLLAATVFTVLAVAAGLVVTPSILRLSADELVEPTVAAAPVKARAAGTSRDADRLARARARSASALNTLPPYQLKQAGAPIKKLPPPPPPKPKVSTGTPFTFQIGTLNVLGSQHTAGPGGYGPGTSRAGMLASAIVNRGVDLLGMQEMQDDQLAVFQRQLPGYGIWPGRALGNNGVRLQIAYRYDMFDVVDTGSITTVFSHQMRPIPYVLLVNRATGGKFYVVDIHNSPQGMESERDAATGPEISLVNQLRATGRPVLLMGDTNEHTEFFCRVAAATGMVGYNGASASGGGCNVGQGPIKIDWIMGGGGVGFTGPIVDYGSPIPTATDHAFVHATTTVTPSVLPGDR